MNDQQKLYRNGLTVDTLYRAVRDSKAVDNVPFLVRQVLEQEMWREHTYEKTGETFRFDSFQQFVETHPPDGLGTKTENLFHLCLEDTAATELLDNTLIAEATRRPEGKDAPIIRRPAITTARQAGLRRLRRFAEQNASAEALRQSVLEGKMSVNAALVAAGLRKPRVTIPKDVQKATEALKRIYTPEERQQMIQALIETIQ